VGQQPEEEPSDEVGNAGNAASGDIPICVGARRFTAMVGYGFLRHQVFLVLPLGDNSLLDGRTA
jgi:hypothetical protein